MKRQNQTRRPRRHPDQHPPARLDRPVVAASLSPVSYSGSRLSVHNVSEKTDTDYIAFFTFCVRFMCERRRRK